MMFDAVRAALKHGIGAERLTRRQLKRMQLCPQMQQALVAGSIPVFIGGNSRGDVVRNAFSRSLMGTEDADQWSVLLDDRLAQHGANEGHDRLHGERPIVGRQSSEAAAAGRGPGRGPKRGCDATRARDLCLNELNAHRFRL